MRVYQSAVVAIVALVAGALPARAQSTSAFTVTSLVGMGTDRAAPISAAIQFPVTSAFSVETEGAYRRGEGNLHAPSANASALYALARGKRFTPYGAVGVGLARYGEAVAYMPAARTGIQFGTAARLAPTFNFGGGLKARLSDRMDFRTDLRWFQGASGGYGDQFRLGLGVGFNFGQR